MPNRTIPELTAAGTLAGADVVHIVDETGNSRKMTLAALKTFINTDPTVVPSSLAYRGARVTRTTNLSVATGTVATIPWQAADRNTDSIWSAGAPTRLTVPAGVTKVRLSSNIEWATGNTGVRISFLQKNGANLSGMYYSGAAASTSSLQNSVSDVLDVTAGDYFEGVLFHTQGSALNLLTGLRTWFAMEIVEATL